MPYQFSKTPFFSSLAFAVVMLQSAWSPANGLDAKAHDDSAQAEPMVTVYPREIKDVLYNPGIGLADFHFGFGHPPSTDQYPRQTVAYFRWSWADLEPEEGRYDFDFVDRIISQAKAKGETLAFRIMTEYKAGSPEWLLQKGVGSVTVGGGVFPDYNSPTFLLYHEKLIKAFGERYAGLPDIDHVDIGSVGCWGEWN
ncbi:MAG: beta-galactosidase, partial [Nitrospirae bacterium]|nr:beta-galactosidase [Nitrospirota bacterium]